MPPKPLHCAECGLPYSPSRGPLGISSVASCPHCIRALAPDPEGGWPVSSGPALRGERGVFTTRAVAEGELVERCWIVPLSREESDFSMKSGVLARYTFPWTENLRALCSGLGLLYNASRFPNTRCTLRPSIQAVEFHVTKDLPAGTELRWDYQRAILKGGPPRL